MTVRNRKPRSLMIPDEEGNTTNNNRLRQQQQQQDDNNGTPVIKKKPVGLVNLGNTCFMNAALQCVCRTPGLLEKLELLISEPMLTFTGSGLTYNDEQVQNNELKFKLVFASESIVKKMVHLLRQMTQGSGGDTVNPRAVHHVMAKNFGAGLQHDSHELLRHILDKLKKDQIRAFRIALMDLFGIPHNEAGKILQTDPQKAQELKDWDKKLYNSTVIDDIFGGELLTTRTCLECGAVKNSTEEFLDISLPIRVVKSGSENKSSNSNSINNRYFPSNELTTINRSLQECFQCFVEPETLSDNNKVDCERCHEQKLNKIKAGVPVNEVFPPEEESPKASTFQSSKASTTNNNKLSNARSQKQTTPQQKQGNNQKDSKRKKKKRKTRKEKMSEDPFPENMSPEKEGAGGNSSNSEPDVPELEKITDEGYAEDYKDSDDSTGASAGDNDATPSDEAQDEEEEDNENDGDKKDEDADEEKADGGDDEDEEDEEAPRPVKQPEIPKSTKTACKRWTMIYRPPKNLTVHLKRFTVSTRGYTQKLTDHVKFTEYIDIREYVTTSFPNDDQTSQVSSNSWSFEEMSKEVDVALGGASGDSAVDSSDRFILAPTASLTSTSVIKSTDEGGDYDVPQNPALSSPAKPEPEVAGPSSSSSGNLIIQPPSIICEMSPSSNNVDVEAGTVTTTGEIETDPVISQEDTDNKAFILPETFDSGNDMDDEPPPYGVSPTPDDYSSNQLRNLNDVPLPELDYTAGWSLDYKSSQGIAEWSAKGIEGGEEEVDSVELPTTVPQEEVPAGPLPLPATSSWDTPAAEASSSRPAVIALGYSSIEDVQLNPDLTTSLEAQVTKEAVEDDADDDDDVMNLGPTLLGDTFEESNNTTSSTSMLNRIESGGAEAEEVKLDPNGINYRLYGIVEHGGSLNWGHYVAYVRVGSEWYYISDSYVSKSDIKSVLDRDPYILFYERVP